MQNPKLIVVGSLNYPSGSAPTNRIHLYCKAINIAGGSSLVISLDAPFNESQPFKYVGNYEGVPYCYTRKTFIRKDGFLKRNLDRIKGLINALGVINKRQKRDKSIVVLFFSLLPPEEMAITLFLKVLKVKIIKESNEAPEYILRGKRHIKWHTFLLKNFKLKRYHGNIIISDYLWRFYSEIYPIQRMIKIPILVDLERFNVTEGVIRANKKNITYIGFIGGTKDGLDDLIESIAIVARTRSDFTLNLVGSGFHGDLERIIKKVDSLNMSETIQILGHKGNTEIPLILAKSDYLILTRPDNTQAKAGFPTKLGEYLASKKPVLITKTGEVINYLTDNKSAYLMEPGDIKGIAEKIIYALDDKNAAAIGMEGFKIAEQNFDYRLYSTELLNFFKQVLQQPGL